MTITVSGNEFSIPVSQDKDNPLHIMMTQVGVEVQIHSFLAFSLGAIGGDI
jgi:hypothetical protein